MAAVLQGRVDELRKALDESRAAAGSKDEEIARLKADTERLADAERELHDLRAKIVPTIQEERKALEAQIESHQKEVARLREQNDALRASADRLKEESGRREETLAKEVAEREAQMSQDRKRGESAERELEKLRKEHADLKASHGALSPVLARLRQELEREVGTRDEKIKNLADQIEKLTAALKEREDHVRKLQGLLGKHGEDYESKVLDLQNKLNAFKPLLQRAQDELKEKTTKIVQLEERLKGSTSTRLTPTPTSETPKIVTGVTPAPQPATTPTGTTPPPQAPPKNKTAAIALGLKSDTTRRKPRFVKTLRTPIPVIKNPPTQRGDSTKGVPVEPETQHAGLTKMADVQLTLSKGALLLRKTLTSTLIGVTEKTLVATIDDPILPGATLHAKLSIKKFGDTIEADVEVLNQSILRPNELYEITCAFSKISDSDRRRLANAISYYSSDAGRAQL
jgi:predicted  nucleic acid-binding Zn-ribbon protein